MHDVSAILFDWDGTLLDSHASGYLASLAVFRHFGITGNRARFLETYNPNWYETYRALGLPEQDWDTADRIWLETYHRNPPDLYPFARRTLEILVENGYAIGLVTSGNRDRVSRELDRHGLKYLFAVRVYFEDTAEKKPHPEPLVTALEQMGISAPESVYVGDRPEDILMGKRTGAFTVGVESAYATREVLVSASPDLVLPDAGHLPARFGPRRG